VVARREPAPAIKRVLFIEPRVNILPLTERILKLWKISAIDMVRNAIVTP
jgi:hypothetical protein